MCLENGALQYRFGTTQHLELLYPKIFNTKSNFSYNHYSRYKVDYLRISFINDNYKYSIYRNVDENISDEPELGVTIVKADSSDTTEKNVACAVVVQDKLNSLIEILPCDKEEALGCTTTQ